MSYKRKQKDFTLLNFLQTFTQSAKVCDLLICESENSFLTTFQFPWNV